MKSISNPICQI